MCSRFIQRRMIRRMHISCTTEFKIQAYLCLNWTTFIPCQRNFWFFHEFIDCYFSCMWHFIKVVLRLWDMNGIKNIMRHLFYYNCTSILCIFPLYMRFITYTINSMFCQICGFISFLDQIIAITFKLSSYRKRYLPMKS